VAAEAYLIISSTEHRVATPQLQRRTNVVHGRQHSSPAGAEQSHFRSLDAANESTAGCLLSVMMYY
jgi:hypothetical protein